MTTALPRLAGAVAGHRRYRVAVVCLGNICRSPMAAVVLEDRLVTAGLDDRVEVVSAGTGPWHVGDPMDERAASTLTGAGYDPTRHRARQVASHWFDDCDVLLAMDAQNHRDLTALAPDAEAAGRVLMFRDLDPLGSEVAHDSGESGTRGRDVPDPYYGGGDGFADVLALVERTSDALVEVLRSGPLTGSAAITRAGG